MDYSPQGLVPGALPPPDMPPRRRSPLRWILIGCGGAAFLGLLACGGCALVTWLAFKAAIREHTEEAERWIKADPDIREALGTVRTVEMKWEVRTATTKDGRKITSVPFTVVGEKASGTLRIVVVTEGGARSVRGAVLEHEGKKTVLLDGSDYETELTNALKDHGSWDD